ncbi:putative disease resistance protein Aig2 [Aspergillus campestris IBT 28561]|uniref:Putative gamma-glutamylcyclotransferase n=1 Tax=Aspergillus campestris (strain IBT 28561) TaxID=1392248 RepID=A0A2I1D1W4_ASPC2|nr:putative disease resistance protein Aig2 [Aspergillus campestris IBT 28561]PKY03861.1 putative disease resistance protein Aig2 [Aspergillus campestris IBT 28561]
MGDHVLFFYGTLMAPQILHRVIHGSPTPEAWQKALLTFKPAVLHGYRRHRVRGADYPGIVRVSSITPSTSTSTGEDTKSSTGELDKTVSVLGTVVSGLTQGDLHRLDIYEGTEYAKERVSVRILQESLPTSENTFLSSDGATKTDTHLRAVLSAAGADFADESEEVLADTYVWSAGAEMLESTEWDFEAFKRDKMAWWVTASEDEW